MAKIKDLEQAKKEVKKKVSIIIEIPENEIDENAKFIDDLGVDSMMVLEIVASIEKQYKIVVPELDIPKLQTLSAIYKLLEQNA